MSSSDNPALSLRYTGPDFEEYCIREGRYLSARRDRSDCRVCPLGDLCEAGFDEQKRRIAAGENPSLTDDYTCQDGNICSSHSLAAPALLEGLTEDQREFVLTHVPSLRNGLSAPDGHTLVSGDIE